MGDIEQEPLPRGVRPHVRFRVGLDQEAELGHGDIIGRLPTAALRLDDGRVSEAHAMISLRTGVMSLLSLRRRFIVAGAMTSDVELRPGLVIEIVPDLKLEVEDVVLPPRVTALAIDGESPIPLQSVASLLDGAQRLRHAYVETAQAQLWNTGSGWRLRVAGGSARDIGVGEPFELNQVEFQLCEIPLTSAMVDATLGQAAMNIELVTRYDTAHVHLLDQGQTVSVSGFQARLLSELVAVGAPIAWDALASELWPAERERASLRSKLDVNLSRLRRKLREAGIRTNLIRADGLGHFELLLYPGDRVRDQS